MKHLSKKALAPVVLIVATLTLGGCALAAISEISPPVTSVSGRDGIPKEIDGIPTVGEPITIYGTSTNTDAPLTPATTDAGQPATPAPAVQVEVPATTTPTIIPETVESVSADAPVSTVSTETTPATPATPTQENSPAAPPVVNIPAVVAEALQPSVVEAPATPVSNEPTLGSARSANLNANGSFTCVEDLVSVIAMDCERYWNTGKTGIPRGATIANGHVSSSQSVNANLDSNGRPNGTFTCGQNGHVISTDSTDCAITFAAYEETI